MAQFEKYHPILTPHYALDWLTKARAIDVQRLYADNTNAPVPITTVATTINQTMRAIFRDQKLVWGVSDRASDAFVGQVGFDPIDMTTHQATLQVSVCPDYQTAATLQELYQRLVAFGTAELKLTTLTVQPVDDPTTEILTTLGFQRLNQQTYQYQR